MKQASPHKVAVVAFDGVVPFDMSTPCEVFGRARSAAGKRVYDVKVCGLNGSVASEHFDIQLKWDLSILNHADTVVVPGLADLSVPISEELVAALRGAFAHGVRIASICSGAFVLAATGLLDGRRATTHWLAAAALAERHPDVEVDANVLFIDSGQLLTSAGASAGMDLCLHMIRRDFGAAVAADAARLAVMPLERAGGQAQFIIHEPPHSSGSLGPLLAWIEKNLDQPLTLEQLAEQQLTTSRTLSRRFTDQLGMTPLQWVLMAKVRRAQSLLETSLLSVERVALAAGFGTAASLRKHFGRVVGTSPLMYRNAFNAQSEHDV